MNETCAFCANEATTMAPGLLPACKAHEHEDRVVVKLHRITIRATTVTGERVDVSRETASCEHKDSVLDRSPPSDVATRRTVAKMFQNIGRHLAGLQISTYEVTTEEVVVARSELSDLEQEYVK